MRTVGRARERETFAGYLEQRISQPWFANARSVRNALERARLRHARRLLDAADPVVGRYALTTFEHVDFAGSRVFSGGAAAVARDTGTAASPAAE